MIRDVINESILTNEELWEILINDADIDYSAKRGNYKLYMHVVPNGKVYVGTTCKTIRTRWGPNGNGYKGQCFYKAIQQYGWDNIQHYVILEHLSHKDADILEEAFITYYKANNPEFGYNRTSGADRRSFKGTSKKVICINTLEIYRSVYDSAKKMGVSSSAIYLNCIGDTNFAGYLNGKPLQWMFYDDYLNMNSPRSAHV